MIVGYAQQLREARTYLQVSVDRLSIAAFRDDLDVAAIVEALREQHAAIGALLAEATA